MNITMSLVSTELDEQMLQGVAQELCATINEETPATAAIAEQPSTGEAGHKGDLVSIGTLVLGLLGSGGVAVSLIGVLKSYMERGRPIEIEMERPDGKKLKIKADNVGADKIDQTMKLAREFFGEP
ncbi:MAG TPA: hypothetical protein VIW80_07220 [Pyrinomonadaceae bacterium]|jgi:hypothetical protein